MARPAAEIAYQESAHASRLRPRARPPQPAIPIWFVTAASWPHRCASPAARRAPDFRRASGFEPKPGRHLAAARRRTARWRSPVRPGRPAGAQNDLFLPGSLPALLPAGALSFRQCAARRAPRRARLRARRLSFLALPQGRRPASPAGGAGRCRCRRPHAHRRRGRRWRATSSTRPRTTWGRQNWKTPRATLAKQHGAKLQCVVGDDLLKKNFPLIHAVGRASSRAAAADRSALGRCQAPEGDAGRQRRVLRYRRARHQARQRHAADEKGHGRRGQCDRARAHDHGPRS